MIEKSFIVWGKHDREVASIRGEFSTRLAADGLKKELHYNSVDAWVQIVLGSRAAQPQTDTAR